MPSLHSNEKSREFCIKTRSLPTSLAFIGQIIAVYVNFNHIEGHQYFPQSRAITVIRQVQLP